MGGLLDGVVVGCGGGLGVNVVAVFRGDFAGVALTVVAQTQAPLKLSSRGGGGGEGVLGALLSANGMVRHRRASANAPHDVTSRFSCSALKKNRFLHTNAAPPMPCPHYFKWSH